MLKAVTRTTWWKYLFWRTTVSSRAWRKRARSCLRGSPPWPVNLPRATSLSECRQRESQCEIRQAARDYLAYDTNPKLHSWGWQEWMKPREREGWNSGEGRRERGRKREEVWQEGGLKKCRREKTKPGGDWGGTDDSSHTFYIVLSWSTYCIGIETSHRWHVLSQGILLCKVHNEWDF